MKLEEKYNDLLGVLDKYKTEFLYETKKIKEKINKRIALHKLQNEYGFNFDISDISYYSENQVLLFNDHCTIEYIRYLNNKKILDNNKKPKKGEELIYVTFRYGKRSFITTNLYSYLDIDAIDEFFNKIIQELLSYNPKYTLLKEYEFYFDLTNGSKLFNTFINLLNKWRTEFSIIEINADIKYAQSRLDKVNKELEEYNTNNNI